MTAVGFVGTYNQADACTLSGGSWATGKPLPNLLTTRVTQTARSLGSGHSATCFKATGGEDPFDVVAFVHHNLTGSHPSISVSENTEIRIRTIHRSGGGLVVPADFNLRTRASSILASSNLTGAVSALQEPDPENKTGAWLTASAPGSNTDLRCNFNVTAETYLLAGAGLQEFRILARRTATGVMDPTLTVELWQSGALVSTLLSGHAIPSTVGELVTVTWNASALSGSPKAADTVQIRVRGIATGTATLEFGSLEFNQEITSSGDITVTDSDWFAPTLPPNYWSGPTSLRKLTVYYRAASATDWHAMWVDIKAGGNAQAYAEIGRLVIVADTPFYWSTGARADPSYGLSLTPVDPSTRERMGDGTLETERQANWLEMELQFSALNEDTVFGTLLGLYAQQGTTGDMLWIPWPEDSSAPVIWGPLKECRPLSIRGYNWWDVPMVVESR